ncbi:MAG: hypothetical protein K0S41_1992 [Anaerocolumna sp.]|jgi:hypothetical protein|nr:hypothetical protein [Anaerocolumna sp.]
MVLRKKIAMFIEATNGNSLKGTTEGKSTMVSFYKNSDFIRNYELAILMTLLEKNQINQSQYDQIKEDLINRKFR